MNSVFGIGWQKFCSHAMIEMKNYIPTKLMFFPIFKKKLEKITTKVEAIRTYPNSNL